jgi:sugar diacid utilization regulator
MSGAHDGLAKLAVSYGEAQEAVEIAVGTGTRGRVIAFDEVLIDSIVRSSPHADRILDDSIGPLVRYDAERQAELVSTLRAYISAGFDRTPNPGRMRVRVTPTEERFSEAITIRNAACSAHRGDAHRRLR